MTDVERREAARQFAEDWKNRGNEKQETAVFWLSLLSKLFGVAEPEKFIRFEVAVKSVHTGFIDGYIGDTRVLIEQKGADIDLRKGGKQSDGSILTPYQQARRYAGDLPHNMNPRWVVVCNFQQFDIHDMNRPNDPPETVMLSDLERDWARLRFLVDTGDEHIKREMEVSLKAGELVGVIYDALREQYKNPDSPDSLKSLNALCVRLVFCLYAEDAGIFGSRNMFHDYLQTHRSEDRRALIDLFRVLDQEPERRDPYLDADLAAFPYVNGGLFADENIEIPRLGDEVIDLILNQASSDFNWADISPTIFGAVFESTLNPDTRRSGGMHYTSIENIHKVIDPLFLDALRAEFAEIRTIAVDKTRDQRLRSFQTKLAGLKFLDPACGSGNFLTETYLSLRRMENEIIGLLNRDQIVIGEVKTPIKVSISQFYGIEINDFAVSVAKTALWIAESQMLKETEDVVRMNLDFLPLKTNACIVEGNALRLDWENIVPKRELNYIMGNPPFVGARMMAQGSQQKREVEEIFGAIKDVQDLDYVTCWYKKAAQLIQDTNIEVGFVSTNSICQGAQVPILWNVLLNDLHIHIKFAHQTFKWSNEAKSKAAVYCIIVGFSMSNPKEKKLFLYKTEQAEPEEKIVENINPYLLPGSDFFVTAQKKPICDVPEMKFGSQPRDGGFFVLSNEERGAILAQEPELAKVIKPYIGADEFIKGKERYCIWLHNEPFEIIKNSKILQERIAAVEKFRMGSKAKTTNNYAKVPAIFAQIAHPYSDYLLVPSVSTNRRRYIPIGFMDKGTIASNLVMIVPNATLYHFGILTSNVHMAWMRFVCGRLGNGYRYSKELVYNTFPWPDVDEKQKAAIEAAAQDVLDERAKHSRASLAELYEPTLMKVSGLQAVHTKLDRVVWAAYGANWKSEAECVTDLMEKYQQLAREDKK